jgi:putative FmdB family regulatory protein
MPTYEYRCPEGHEFEVFQKMSDPPVAACPTCGEDAERRLSGGAGLLFKGSGFYITDYRSEDYKKAAAKESGGAKPSSDKDRDTAPGKATSGDGGGAGASGGAGKGDGGTSEGGPGGGGSKGSPGGGAPKGGSGGGADA